MGLSHEEKYIQDIAVSDLEWMYILYVQSLLRQPYIRSICTIDKQDMDIDLGGAIDLSKSLICLEWTMIRICIET